MGTRARIYARQSKDRAEGIADQVEKCRRLIAGRGWTETGPPLADNDVSASSGRPRPGYERAIAAVKGGELDYLVVSVMDRLYRRVTELESIIPVMEASGVKVVAVGGEYDLSTDTGRLVARILASVAQGEVETKARRQRDAAARAAQQGRRWIASVRPFGWRADDHREPDELEAAAIREACRMILAGGTVCGVTRLWTAMGVRPAQAPSGPLPERPWARQSVRAVLANPAIAGLRQYKGAIIAEGDWEGIVSRETFTAVRSILDDPGRKVPRGTTSLLGGIGTCRCGAVIQHTIHSKGHGVYKCSKRLGDGPHVCLRSDLADGFVTEHILARMTLPDAAGMFASTGTVDVQALRDEAQAIRANTEAAASDMVTGILPRAAYLAAMERAGRRLAEIDAAAAEASRVHVAAELITAEDVRETWRHLDISRQRAIVRALLSIELRPAGRGARFPDPQKVFKVRWTA